MNMCKNFSRIYIHLERGKKWKLYREFKFIRKCQLVFQSCTNSYSPDLYKGNEYWSTFSLTLNTERILNFCQFSGYKILSHVVLICITCLTNSFAYSPLICLFTIVSVLLEEACSYLFACVSIGLLIFFLLIYK